MNAITNLVNRYLDAFNETDGGRRAALIDKRFTDDCGYTDPMIAAKGKQAIDGFIGAVQKQFPGAVFTLSGSVDAHHDIARFTWHAGPKAGPPLAIGFDVIVLDGERIRQVHGFLDQAPG
jgi:hypothetical protein